MIALQPLSKLIIKTDYLWFTAFSQAERYTVADLSEESAGNNS
jgi:hypothetical protein